MDQPNARISGISLTKTSLQKPLRPLIIGGILSVFTFGNIFPIVNAKPVASESDFKKFPVLTMGIEETGGSRYLVKLRNNYQKSADSFAKSKKALKRLGLREEDFIPLWNENTAGLQKGKNSELSRTYVINVNLKSNPAKIAAELSALPSVERVEPDNLTWALATYPNDSFFNRQWSLHNTGQTGGKSDADIDAPEGWDTATGAQGIVLAVIDTGVDSNHRDLQGKVINGYDFANHDSNPMDDHGHGTHVAGIAAAKTDNNRGIAGVCWDCRVMPVKVLTGGGWGYNSWVAQGITYAANNGADVINLSLGFAGYSWAIRDAIQAAHDQGVTVVAAAGNCTRGCQPIAYPARYPETIAVAATDHKDKRAWFSSVGSELDLSAPGVSILSTLPYQRYAWWSGTSMATPVVTGAVGVLLSFNSTLSPEGVRQCLKESADNLGSQWYYGAGRLNLERLLQFCAEEN